ncbi:MAG TPA: TIGR03885 family FMN-dependent LLM class oxidoreductase [Longimicrobiales bacterium]|nr:TIGR03885 family FMN-dependent LLM class oxidoreductase [Longimicrobiales bacterium]
MASLGYHASHEQHAPSALLRYVQAAEHAGFDEAMCSDHYFPWSDRQGESGFAFGWLGAALQATSFSFGSVCAPGQRYHPAIVAQAAATLAEMFPGRYWIALGSGQYLNEHITGTGWPVKEHRNARLREAVDVIRALWAGDTVTHRGHFVVEDACLYTRPATPPLIVGAAVTPETAAWVAEWADALITIAKPFDEMQLVIDAFRRGGGAGKPMFLQAQLSFAPSREEALMAAHEEWGTNIFDSALLTDLRMPADFEAAAKYVRPEDVTDSVRVSDSPDQHAEWLARDIELGFDRIFLHNVQRDQERFIEVFGERVLPAVR